MPKKNTDTFGKPDEGASALPSLLNGNQNQCDEISLIGLLRILRDGQRVIYLISIFFVLISIAIAIMTTPTFLAESLVAPAEKKGANRLNALVGQFGGLASLAGINLGGRSSSGEALALLKSRDFTNKFISDLNLLPVLFSGQWNKKESKWNDEANPPTLWKAYRYFDKSIRSVSIDSKTGFITVGIEWKDPVVAAEWVNLLVERLNTRLRMKAITEAKKSIKYLESELQKTSVIDVKQSIYRLIEAQTKNKMLASTRKDFAFKVLDPAVAPEIKVRPKRTVMVIAGSVLGVVFSVVIVLLMNFFRKIRENI